MLQCTLPFLHHDHYYIQRPVGVWLLQTGVMATQETVTAFLELEELQKDTLMTRDIAGCIKRLQSLDQEGEEHIERYATNIRDAFSEMLKSVQIAVLYLLGGIDFGCCFIAFH